MPARAPRRALVRLLLGAVASVRSAGELAPSASAAASASLALLALLAPSAGAQLAEHWDPAFDPAQLETRSIDGSGNNPQHPGWGAAGAVLRRMAPAAYADGAASPAGPDRPGAREVSDAVAAQAGDLPASRPASGFVFQWGQFLDHDLDLTDAASPAEPFPVPVPAGDPWFDPAWTGAVQIGLDRSRWTLVPGSPVREQVNLLTAWIDASNVYGSDAARAAALRLPDGRLRTSPGDLLPFNTQGLPNAPSTDAAFFLAGDVRANEQVALTAMHVLFVREHNRLVGELKALKVPLGLRYDIARALVGAEMQAITYREFLPVVLGPDALPPYAGWDPAVDAGIANEFSSACFRFGHSMLPAALPRLQADLHAIAEGELPLKDAFFTPQELVDHGVEPLLRGLARLRVQEPDGMIVDGVRNFLFGPPGAGGFDLASLNVQRGRDHGLPGYAQARVALGMAPVAGFADVCADPVVQARLASVYDHVGQIDLWVGMLAEDRVPGCLVGELARAVLADQFARLRDGDRFWYQRSLPAFLVEYVEQRTLADVIRDNTAIGDEISDHAFLQPWLDLGASLAGAAGPPRLLGQGSLLPGTPARLQLDGAAPGAPGLMLVGFQAQALPFKGGTVVPAFQQAPGAVVPFATGAQGVVGFDFEWPDVVPGGTTLYVQAWLMDAGGPAGVAASNALRGDAP